MDHEALIKTGEDRVAEFNRVAPRCRWCADRPGFEVLDGLCTPCRVAWAAPRQQAMRDQIRRAEQRPADADAVQSN